MPDTGGTHRHLPAYIWLLAILIVLGTLAYFLQGYLTLPIAQPQQSVPDGFPAQAPAPAAADYTTAQHGFQYLVAYTDSGFHPTALTIHTGETIRFTDNSAIPLTISADKTQSPPLTQGQYWEHTFTTPGTFQYESAGGASGTVVVQ